MRISDWSSDVCSSDLQRERVGRMLLMHANSREDVKEARAGDIVAIAGLKHTTTGDTLCDPLKPVIPPRMHFPEPLLEVAVAPTTMPAQERVGVAPARTAADTQSFRVSLEPLMGQPVSNGLG